MRGSFTLWRWQSVVLLTGIGALCLFGLLPDLSADTIQPVPLPVLTQPGSPAISTEVEHHPPALPEKVIDLAGAKALALEKQPAVTAAHIGLATALASKKAIDELRVPTFLQPDLPIRRQQSALGIVAAEAAVKLAEIDAIYAVQYTYVSYLYAQTQLQMVENSERGLRELRELVRKFTGKDEGNEGVFRTDVGAQWSLTRLDALQEMAQARKKEAQVGARRALSALREAMGVPDACHLVPAHCRLFDVDVHLDCGKLVELALTRRPEILQASIGLEVSNLEVSAQAQRRRALRVNTFAAGSDIHANPLPAMETDDEYRPGALGPAMPTMLAGSVCNRVNVASKYRDRASTVLEKTRQLIQLQVEQAYLRYCETREKVLRYEKAAQLAVKSQKYTSVRFARGKEEATLTELLVSGQLATEMRVRAYEARYQMLLALIALERHTVGGFCAGLDGAPQIPPPPSSRVTEEERKAIEKELRITDDEDLARRASQTR